MREGQQRAQPFAIVALGFARPLGTSLSAHPSSGGVIIEVAIATSTITVYICGVRIPRLKPSSATTISMPPRAFMPVATASASGHSGRR